MLGDNRPRVLVVDDVADVANSLALLLELWGYDVEVCYAGGAALESARSCQPHVVLLDVGLPGLDGFQVARRIGEVPGGQHAVFIAITGYGHEACRSRAEAMGFQHYLVKPVEPDYLRELLQQIVGPMGFAAASHAPSNGTHNRGPNWAKWLSVEIPASRKAPVGQTHSLVS
jgi:CheY-like chemotaxis protein